ncbi:MAG: hypothetical protein U0U70_13210 [Chitinophagaceae bacterium]
MENETRFSSLSLIPLGEPLEYNRAPLTEIALGRGFDPINLSDIKRPCIKFKPTPLDGGGSTLATFEYYYVANYESLQEELKIDTKVAASYLKDKLDLTFKSSFENSFSSNSINVILKAYAEYGRWSLDPEADLIEEAKKIRDQNPKKFIETFGSRYIATENRMNAIYVLITVYSVSTIIKRKMESSLSAGIGIGKLTASAKEAFISELKNTVESDRISTNAYTIGGTGITGFKDLIIENIKREKDPLRSIGEALSKTVGQLDVSNSIPYSFIVTSMSKFGIEEKPNIEWSFERSKTLSILTEIYRNVYYKLSILKGLEAKNHPLYFLIDDEALIKNLIKDINVIDEFLLDIKARHKNCQESTDPTTFAIPTQIPTVLSNHYLDFLKSPTIQFLGFNINTGETAPTKIRTEVLENILNSSPETRNTLIKSFFPNSSGIGVTINASGLGLSIMSLFVSYTANRLASGETWSGEITLFNGIPGGFDLLRLETKIIAEVLKNRPIITEGETIRFQCKLYCRLTNKAQLKYTFLLLNCNIEASYLRNETKTLTSLEYYLMDAFDK